jgi:hypothetical protein
VRSEAGTQTLPCEVNFTRPQKWLLLPATLLSPEVTRAFDFVGYGIKAAYTFYKETGTSPFKKGHFKLPKLASRLKQIPMHSPEFSKTFLEVIHTNQRLRWRFKRLVQKWRLSRLRQANTVDVVTMEPPTMPVYVYDWPNRTKYLFEAQTLFRGIRTSLTAAQELFPTPQQPKNPFTNQVLSYGQLHFALNELRSKGMADWVTESMLAAGYEVDIFRRRAMQSLRLNALKVLFANPTTDEYLDLVYDFVDFVHDDVGIAMEQKDVWEWGILNAQGNSLIQAWRSLCYRYYKGLVTLTDAEFNHAKTKILAEAEELVKMSMKELSMAWLKRKILSSN